MVPLHITPRLVAPYLLSGVTSIHILSRMRRLSRSPASDVPIHVFLLKHTDVILVLSSGPVLWRFTQRLHKRTTSNNSPSTDTIHAVIPKVAHQLREVFTVLLIGLGLIRRETVNGGDANIRRIADRLGNAVAEGIKAVNVLDPPSTVSGNRLERQNGA